MNLPTMSPLRRLCLRIHPLQSLLLRHRALGQLQQHFTTMKPQKTTS
jgi:hypothetical protein